MDTTLSELQALAALLGGVDAAAEETGIDEELYQSILDGASVERRTGGRVDILISDYYDNSDVREQVETAARMFEYIGERRGNWVVEYLANEGELTRLDDASALFFNFTDKQIDAIFKGVQKDADFIEALKAFEADEYNVWRSESEFWKWFREMYGS